MDGFFHDFEEQRFSIIEKTAVKTKDLWFMLNILQVSREFQLKYALYVKIFSRSTYLIQEYLSSQVVTGNITSHRQLILKAISHLNFDRTNQLHFRQQLHHMFHNQVRHQRLNQLPSHRRPCF